MEKVSLQYTAGFVDGEGCIRIDKSYPKKRSIHYKLQIIVVNTNLEILTLFKEQFGGHLYRRIHKGREAYYWSMYCQDAEEFVKVILPFLVIKKPQAELALQFQESKKMGKPTPSRPLDQDELDLREAYYQQMKELNARKPVETTKECLTETMV
uniref:Putative homing endonuclease n=1 Tax=viral metagenome TaxID=1070528 RepID=A0A6M3J479_9ZZZZ